MTRKFPLEKTRNIGIKTSKGEYIQFIDADDFIDPYMIEETLKEIEKNKADSVITGLYLDIESENEIKSSKQTFEYKIEDKFKILNGIKFCAVFRKLSENFR